MELYKRVIKYKNKIIIVKYNETQLFLYKYSNGNIISVEYELPELHRIDNNISESQLISKFGIYFEKFYNK